MSTKRDDIIDTTSDLLERQGYFATGVNQIVAESGAPKGSLYYYFPGGKDEITEEAIRRAGAQVTERLERLFGDNDSPGEALAALAGGIARAMKAAQFVAGSPITTVALETAVKNQRLSAACREVYEAWRSVFEVHIARSGVAAERAERLSTLVLAAIEGGIILSRTYESDEPLRRVAAELHELLESAR
ncbi:MAG: TetR/AcrR family transcriptional regulator [Persicimonas sp.]